MADYIYQVCNLKHWYNTQPVLDIDNLTISRASILGLMGPNGSGKSTLLRLLGFIDSPTKGEILFKGKPGVPFSNAVRFKVTLLPQTPYLMKRSVYKNIAYGLKLRGDTNDYRKEIYKALDIVGLSGETFAERRWYELSGGEAQRVALAARIVLNPEVLLMDEPTASVDASSARLIRDASVQACRERGATLVIASHDWQWLYEVCDEVLHLFKGRSFGSGNESVIFGPWQPRNDGLWEKTLHDGQYIIVSKPPEKDSAAVISSDHITVGTWENDKKLAGNACLNGIISRLVLEKRSGRIITSILVENVPMTTRLTPAKVQELSLYPGQKVKLCYDPNSVKWV